MTRVDLQRYFAIAITLALLLLLFELMRRKRLSERYAILWLLTGLTLFVLVAWKGLLTSLSHDVGIYYPPSALFTVAIGLIAMILLHFSLAVSRLSSENKVLAQRVALQQQRLSLLQERLEEGEDRRFRRPAEIDGDIDEPAEPPSPAVAAELFRSR
ncbi:MAG: DUF2304 domain-containing protein [Solirubrobacteraceae bacterium]